MFLVYRTIVSKIVIGTYKSSHKWCASWLFPRHYFRYTINHQKYKWNLKIKLLGRYEPKQGWKDPQTASYFIKKIFATVYHNYWPTERSAELKTEILRLSSNFKFTECVCMRDVVQCILIWLWNETGRICFVRRIKYRLFASRCCTLKSADLHVVTGLEARVSQEPVLWQGPHLTPMLPP